MATTIGELTEPLRKLVRAFLERYPEAQPQDLYRMIYEGTCGYGKEAAAVPEAADLAVAAARAAGGAEAIESIAVDGSMVRVHLGAYTQGGGDLAALAAAALRTAREHQPRRDLLFTLWAGFVHMNRRHEFRMNRDALDHFEMRIASAGYPGVEHSKQFIAAYKPAYAVVLRRALEAPADPAAP